MSLSKREPEIPKEFIDPITRKIMINPVKTFPKGVIVDLSTLKDFPVERYLPETALAEKIQQYNKDPAAYLEKLNKPQEPKSPNAMKENLLPVKLVSDKDADEPDKNCCSIFRCFK